MRRGTPSVAAVVRLNVGKAIIQREIRELVATM